jgi:hypothetical protein
MRFLVVVTTLTLALLLGLTGSLAAKGGKGGGKAGRSKPSGTHGPKFSGNSTGKSHQGKNSVKQDKPQLAKKNDKPSKDDRGKLGKKSTDSGPADDDGTTGEPTQPNKKEKQLANFQRQRDKKLAQAEHLRQIAEQNGNANLAANADRMEAQALDQYAQKAAHLEKFGITDPALDPGGVTDPLVPDIDPLVPDIDPLFPVGSY